MRPQSSTNDSLRTKRIFTSFVQFVNLQPVHGFAGLALLVFQSVCLFSSALSTLIVQQPIFELLQYMGATPFIVQIIIHNNSKTALAILALLLLLVTIVPLSLALVHWIDRLGYYVISNSIEQTRSFFSGSAYFAFCRILVNTNAYVLLPIASTLAGRIFNGALSGDYFTQQNLCLFQIILSILIFLAIPLCQLFHEYCLLELVPPAELQYVLMRTNISAHIADQLTLFAACLLVTVPHGSDLKVAAGIIVGVLRLALSLYLPYFRSPALLKVHNFILCCYFIGACSLLAINLLGSALMLFAFDVVLWVALGLVTFTGAEDQAQESDYLPLQSQKNSYMSEVFSPKNVMNRIRNSLKEETSFRNNNIPETTMNHTNQAFLTINGLSGRINNSIQQKKKSSFSKNKIPGQNRKLRHTRSPSQVPLILGEPSLQSEQPKQQSNKGSNGSLVKSQKEKDKKLQMCQRVLDREGRIAFVFRELVVYERMNTNHRDQLLIEYLKRRCIASEEVMRGGQQILAVEQVLRFEALLKDCVVEMGVLGDHALSIAKFLESKESLPEVFQAEVRALLQRVRTVQSLVGSMLKINRKSQEAVDLSFALYQFLIRDNAFLKNVEAFILQHQESGDQLLQRKRIFNSRSTAVFINVLEDPGKVTRVSKNVEAVLGYPVAQLRGMNITELMPHSLKRPHKYAVLDYLRRYSIYGFPSSPSSDDTRSSTVDEEDDYSVSSYVLDKDFTLQQAQMTYSFHFPLTGCLEMCGLLKVSPVEHPLVLLGPNGCLEGWSAEMGVRLGLNKLGPSDCTGYNFLLLVPTLIKYFGDGMTQSKELRTLLFVPKSVEHKHSIAEAEDLGGSRLGADEGAYVTDRSDVFQGSSRQSSTQPNHSNLQQSLMDTFEQSYRRGEYSAGYLVVVNVTPLSLCRGRARMYKLEFSRMEEVENLADTMRNVYFVGANKGKQPFPGTPEEQSIQSTGSRGSRSVVSMNRQSEVSSAKSRRQVQNDFSFSPRVDRQEIQLSVVNTRNMRINHVKSADDGDTENNDRQEMQSRDSSETLIKSKNRPVCTGTPSLPRTRLGAGVWLFALAMVVLTFYQVLDLQYFQEAVLKECRQVQARNLYYMVFIKSAFNPNLTYISKVDEGEYLQSAEWLKNEYYHFLSSETQTFNFTKSYTFNVMIPTMLSQLLETGNYSTYKLNYKPLMVAFDTMIDSLIASWIKSVDWQRLQFVLRIAGSAVGGLFLAGYIVWAHMQYKQRNKIIDAFFKFQKSDLEAKSHKIYELLKQLELKAEEWFIHRFFCETIKTRELHNVRFQNQSEIVFEDPGLGFEATHARQTKLQRQWVFTLASYIVCFLVVQACFFASYSALALDMLTIYRKVPLDLDRAHNIILIPNMLMAELFVDNPKGMVDRYSVELDKILAVPFRSVPLLFDYVEKAPCPDCPFLYPLLTTNYRSFYSTFVQLVREKKLTGDLNITQMFYAVDVVVNNLVRVLEPTRFPIVTPIELVYLLSMVVFVAAGFRVHRKNNTETTELEDFLKCFDEETLQKNKHLNNIVKKQI